MGISFTYDLKKTSNKQKKPQTFEPIQKLILFCNDVWWKFDKQLYTMEDAKGKMKWTKLHFSNKSIINPFKTNHLFIGLLTL